MGPMPADDPDSLASELAEALASSHGPVTIEGLRRLTGGASRETWSFDATTADGHTHALILRQDFRGGATQNPDVLAGRLDALDRAGEYALLDALHRKGVPVPRPVALPTGALTSCFIMERVEGEARPHVLVRDEGLTVARDGLAAQLGSTLARIHGLGERDLPPLPHRDVEEKLAIARTLLDRAPLRPALEMAFRWCVERKLAPTDLRLVHGDYRTSNYLVGPEGLRVVFDWEFAHLGDPHEDLAYLCMRAWRFGVDDMEVGGVGSRENLYRGYEAAGGGPIDPAAVRYAEILAHLFTATVFLMRAVQYLDSSERSLEGAAIGRRVAEIEYDLVRLLD
jgi:aminoglycoside phosphotransferase (APT) family kinase protein